MSEEVGNQRASFVFTAKPPAAKTAKGRMSSSSTPWANLVEGLERLLSLRAGTPNHDPEVYASTKRMIAVTAARVSRAENARVAKLESEIRELRADLRDVRRDLADTRTELLEIKGQQNEGEFRF